MVKYQDDGRVTADAATGLSSPTEPQSSQGLGPSGFDPSRGTIDDGAFFPVRFLATDILWLWQDDASGKAVQINLTRDGGVQLARAILRLYGERG